jgi:hypothetical protein|tara:strand:+ start:1386 stop:1850 length:465 start_codon:yes stop_codon:yes gene_type:complete
MRVKRKGRSLCLIVVLLAGQVLAEDDPEGGVSKQFTVYEYVTCAVYFRMLIGALRSNRSDLSSLEDVYMDQMNRAMARGKQAAIKEWGAEDADKEFDLEWQSEYSEMVAEIDRNFTRIRELKMKYAKFCDQMTGTEEQIKITTAPTPTHLHAGL